MPLNPSTQFENESIHFVTGRLAATMLKRIVPALAKKCRFDYTIQVLPITVAALMTPAWIAKHLSVSSGTTMVLLPGSCTGDVAPLKKNVSVPIVFGPKNLYHLAEYFGQEKKPDYDGDYSIEILAEINHAPRLPIKKIIALAKQLISTGANVIDLGCEPGSTWTQVDQAVKALRDLGFRVSIDSLNIKEISLATKAGAELVLSVNNSNRHAAADWGVEVVVIPETTGSLSSNTSLQTLAETIEYLAVREVSLRIDPILSPIGFGFAESLERYLAVRKKYPDAEIMMGIGNLTELTDVDSAGINTLLLGFCQELQINSVLTTQVINWARTSVRECDLARRLVHHACTKNVLPKRIEERLITLRDSKVAAPPTEDLKKLATNITDPNFRIFVSEDKIHLVGKNLHLQDSDPFILMKKLLEQEAAGQLLRPLSSSHSFYLGYEMHKAKTALTLHKNYQQDDSLDWGYLTEPEQRHYLISKNQRKK